MVKSEFTLDNRGLGHEEFELGECRVGLVSAPGRLKLDSSQDWTVGTLVLVSWVPDSVLDLDFVGNARKDVFFGILLVVEVRHLEQTQHVNVDEADAELRNKLLDLLHQLRDHSPLCNVLSLELGVLRR